MSAQELFDLTDKVAIITGGAGGIGIVYAEALCEAGAAVVIADVNAQAADEAAAGLVAKGHKAVGTVVDVRSPESTEAMAQAAVDAFGGIDILINNAAIMFVTCTMKLPFRSFSGSSGINTNPGPPPGNVTMRTRSPISIARVTPNTVP